MRVTYTSVRAHRPDILGPELAPSMAAANWTAGNGALKSNDAAGNLKVEYNAINTPFAYAAITVETGAVYRVAYTLVADGAAQKGAGYHGTTPYGGEFSQGFPKNTTLDVSRPYVAHVIASATTLYVSFVAKLTAAGYMKAGGLSVRKVTTTSHDDITPVLDDLFSTAAYTAIDATLSPINEAGVFGVYDRANNAISIVNTSAATGQAARTYAFPTVAGRTYKASSLWIPHSCVLGNLLVGTTYGNGQLGSVAKAGTMADFFTAASGLLWEFNNADDSWTVTNATKANNATYISLTATSTDPQFARAGLSFDGGLATHRYVSVRIRRTSASWTNEFQLFYSTAGHGHSGSHYAGANVATLVQNEWTIVVFDLWQLIAGGTDWQDSTITGLRFDATSTNGATFDIDFVAVGALNPLELEFVASGSTAFLTLVNSTGTGATSYYLTPSVVQLDSDYTLEQAAPESLKRRLPDMIGEESVAADGTRYAVIDRVEAGWDVMTDVIEDSARADWEEFFASVIGVPFTFDPLGTLASPVEPRPVYLTGKSIEPVGKRLQWRIGFSATDVVDAS